MSWWHLRRVHPRLVSNECVLLAIAAALTLLDFTKFKRLHTHDFSRSIDDEICVSEWENVSVITAFATAVAFFAASFSAFSLA